MSTCHELKLDIDRFDRVYDGEKTAEIRIHDRDYQVGDIIEFQRWNSKMRQPEGAAFLRVITHVLPAAHFPEGLQSGYCLLSLQAPDAHGQ